MLFISMDHRPAIFSPASKAVRPTTESWLGAPTIQRTATAVGGGVRVRECERACACASACMCDVFAIYDNNILPRLIMIIIKVIILYFIQIRHTDDFPSTGTRLVLHNVVYIVHFTSLSSQCFLVSSDCNLSAASRRWKLS